MALDSERAELNSLLAAVPLGASELIECLPHGIGGLVRVDPAADVVDDVGDLTAGFAVEPDGRQVVELDAGDGGGLDGAVGFHGRVAKESSTPPRPRLRGWSPCRRPCKTRSRWSCRSSRTTGRERRTASPTGTCTRGRRCRSRASDTPRGAR